VIAWLATHPTRQKKRNYLCGFKTKATTSNFYGGFSFNGVKAITKNNNVESQFPRDDRKLTHKDKKQANYLQCRFHDIGRRLFNECASGEKLRF